MFIAVGTDANGLTVPVAYGLGTTEDTANWTRFLECLKDASAREFTVISDRDKGLAAALPAVFPNCKHLACSEHVKRNVGNDKFAVPPYYQLRSAPVGPAVGVVP
ncbi:hypothetical protein DIPPA_07198 [Diplonema papillatum]|nr:hypothetical protein DIPPA_07198 [Diplonema papillatum]